MALNQNQFALETLKGTKYAGSESSVMSVEFYSATASDTIAPGTMVILSSASVYGKVPRVAVGADATSDYIGVVLTNPLKDSYAVGDKMEIGLLGAVVIMEAGAAISAGALLQYTVSGSKVITKTSTNTVVGRALEPASADAVLFRALIKVS